MHFKISCSCGEVIAACGCPGEKHEEVKLHACPVCLDAKRRADAVSGAEEVGVQCRHGQRQSACVQCMTEDIQREMAVGHGAG